ncbi:MAG TPA: hypothetical protein VMU11_00125 [Verrucomicrobiae bacterium]|nr:hypothetical protein [Verrucomicrobiae bacterium]
MRRLLVTLLLLGCAAMPVHHAHPRSELAGDDVLFVAVRGRRPYLRHPEHETLRIRIGFYLREAGIGHSGIFHVPTAGGDEERLWMPLTVTVFTDIARFLEHGFVSIEAVGIGRDEHPLRHTCYRDLIRAATADIETRRIHHLYVQVSPRPDPEYGCIYHLRP